MGTLADSTQKRSRIQNPSRVARRKPGRSRHDRHRHLSRGGPLESTEVLIMQDASVSVSLRLAKEHLGPQVSVHALKFLVLLSTQAYTMRAWRAKYSATFPDPQTLFPIWIVEIWGRYKEGKSSPTCQYDAEANPSVESSTDESREATVNYVLARAAVFGLTRARKRLGSGGYLNTLVMTAIGYHLTQIGIFCRRQSDRNGQPWMVRWIHPRSWKWVFACMGAASGVRTIHSRWVAVRQ